MSSNLTASKKRKNSSDTDSVPTKRRRLLEEKIACSNPKTVERIEEMQKRIKYKCLHRATDGGFFGFPLLGIFLNLLLIALMRVKRFQPLFFFTKKKKRNQWDPKFDELSECNPDICEGYEFLVPQPWNRVLDELMDADDATMEKSYEEEDLQSLPELKNDEVGLLPTLESMFFQYDLPQFEVKNLNRYKTHTHDGRKEEEDEGVDDDDEEAFARANDGVDDDDEEAFARANDGDDDENEEYDDEDEDDNGDDSEGANDNNNNNNNNRSGLVKGNISQSGDSEFSASDSTSGHSASPASRRGQQWNKRTKKKTTIDLLSDSDCDNTNLSTRRLKAEHSHPCGHEKHNATANTNANKNVNGKTNVNANGDENENGLTAGSEFARYPLDHPSIRVTIQDMGRLRPNAFLNDTLIDFYLKSHIFNTFFYKKLQTAINTSAFELDNFLHRWTQQVDIFAKDIIIIPINDILHWSLAIVTCPGQMPPALPLPLLDNNNNNNNNNNIDNDSNSNNHNHNHNNNVNSSCPLSEHKEEKDWKKILQTHEDLLNITKKPCKDPRRGRNTVVWNAESCPGVSLGVPQQKNHWDCGVFVLKYVHLFLHNPIFNSGNALSRNDWCDSNEVVKIRTEIKHLLCELRSKQGLSSLDIDALIRNLNISVDQQPDTQIRDRKKDRSYSDDFDGCVHLLHQLESSQLELFKYATEYAYKFDSKLCQGLTDILQEVYACYKAINANNKEADLSALLKQNNPGNERPTAPTLKGKYMYMYILLSKKDKKHEQSTANNYVHFQTTDFPDNTVQKSNK
ncbi:SUMO deconjugating cysteine peptidase Ulp2 (predicted) [Reticulomyxa filosa]|uniref:SUMO deconjugating cysteine peptidase Ulp2 (Predicted) n=1 Tax=Reticulomyxa filosa TaxID=46433 RepID=X6MCU9_RETFI|nr:SUMO deconjugating cysteine peptidase Ulp2 (predicted) [Reticulomyxa filosa]|eukprot:ETO11833.1 SUMO deconjugating cysteine peptidase Ulp2 (predicted) [Reticulomyxa filosa]